MQKFAVILILLLIMLKTLAQEPVYFNNIYQHENNFAVGMTILETEGVYIGYGGTESSTNAGQMILLFKIDNTGNELLWQSYGENNHNYYYGNVGGAMIKTNDGNFALACHYGYGNEAYGTLLKLNTELEIIWQEDYHPIYKTVIVNCIQTEDNGFVLTGWVWETENDFSDVILLKTDMNGNYQWHQLFGGIWAEHGTNVIQLQDKGYLLGGYFWKPGNDHSMDAMVIKTDSLGNQEWVKYYGNPNVDDDMALLAMTDDGNYLVATVYGEWVITPSARTGRVYLVKINNQGDTLWSRKIGPKMMDSYIKNLRLTSAGNLIANGFFMDDTASNYIYRGFILKFTENGDSIWMHEYSYYDNQYDMNLLYDAYPTSDNGYIAIGSARPDMGDKKMWIVKVDSMGCDTPGCITTVFSEELPVNTRQGIKVWPNPCREKVWITYINHPFRGDERGVMVYNSHGMKVEEIRIPENSEILQIDVSRYQKGLYYLRYFHSDKTIETVKFIKN